MELPDERETPAKWNDSWGKWLENSPLQIYPQLRPAFELIRTFPDTGLDVMSTLDAPLQLPSHDEVREALERIVTSQPFRASPQLAYFLSFVVEAVLQGKSSRIKGYTIGVEVLRRDIKFDPQLDPIVRVEATRLRRALERYYSGPGADAAVIIDLPRGSYVPSFRRRAAAPEELPAPRAPQSWLHQTVWISAGSLLALVLILCWAVFLRPSDATLASRSSGNGMPTIAVQEFEVTGVPGANSLFLTALTEKVRDALSRFDAVNIASKESPADRSIDYKLYGAIEYRENGAVSIRFSLRDVRDSNVVWSRLFDDLSNRGVHSKIEDGIAAEVATTLLQPFGFIRSRERARYLADQRGDPRYECLLLASDAFRSFNPQDHAEARKCLQEQIKIHPGFSQGYSYLAVVYNREWTYGFGQAADSQQALDIALKLAQRGVEMSPGDARAWQILSSVFFSRHDSGPAIAASERALALNPNDVIIAADYGGRLITVGEVERGMAILENTPTSSGIRPSWQNFYLFLGNYIRDNIPEATRNAEAMTGDTYSLGLFARAFVAGINGNKQQAQENWSKLVELRSAWGRNPRSELERFVPAPAILDRLMRDLARSGLS